MVQAEHRPGHRAARQHHPLRSAPLINYCHTRNVAAPDNPAATDTPATQNFSHLPWQTALRRPRITSDYWRVWFAVLEEAGLAVQLVNSSQARNLPGRPKTDKEDARWIARLTEMGLLRPSFVPPPDIRALRLLTRHISDLTADRTRCWQRLEKLLEDALCKLTSVVPELAGHQTARAVIEKMIAGTVADTECSCDLRCFLPAAGGIRTHTTAESFARSRPATTS